jgi:hypothetical protein
MKTSELIGPALDWAVAMLEGDLVPTGGVMIQTWPYYSSDWAHGGPIIEREKLDIECRFHWAARLNGHSWSTGPTPLIAAMRSFVESKLGDEIDIPEELK